MSFVVVGKLACYCQPHQALCPLLDSEGCHEASADGKSDQRPSQKDEFRLGLKSSQIMKRCTYVYMCKLSSYTTMLVCNYIGVQVYYYVSVQPYTCVPRCCIRNL